MVLRTETALVPVGGTPLASGRVEVLDPATRGCYARLRYRLRGALPEADLSIRLLVHPFDPTGTNLPLPFATVALRTTAAGDGTSEVEIRGEEVPVSVRDAVHGLRWEVLHDGAVLYRTACCSVRLRDSESRGFHRRESEAGELTITPATD